jgi:hypothetical protein
MKSITPYLTYAGALPFVICAVCRVLASPMVPGIGPVDIVLSSYAIVILSFMAGVHWGQHLHLGDGWSRHLPVLSNLITLAGWFAFLFLGPRAVAYICAIAFAVLYVIDLGLFRAGHLSQRYIILRRNVTGIVVASLTLSAVYA